MKPLFAGLFAVAFVLVTPAARAQETGPALETAEPKLRAALHCPSSFDDPDHGPVLLVHGTFTDDGYNWGWSYLPALTAAGFDVCTVTLPDHSLGDMQVQAEYVVYAVRQMAARSGDLVSMIGASQGTLHPRWAVKWWADVRGSVDDIIFLAGPHHGTDVARLGATLGQCFASCWQMASGSNYLTALNDGDGTPGHISYTSLYTLTDELVQPQLPTSTSVLDGATNVAIQDLCPTRPVDHVSISTSDAVAYWLAVDALTHPGAADPARFDIATCAQPFIDGTTPLDLFSAEGSANFNGQYIAAEPPLKAYAKPSSASPGDAPQGAAADDGEPAPTTAPDPVGETPVGDEGAARVEGVSLPATGTNVLRLIATAMVALALGLALRERVRRATQSV
jgi:triacylglycerol lipase